VERKVEGLTGRALKGDIEKFEGISDPYEEPLSPEVMAGTDRETEEESVNMIAKNY
jgi:adenylylsulfate kinase (EC 2.7.1.25)